MPPASKIEQAEVRAALIDGIVQGFGPVDSAALAGIHRATLYRWTALGERPEPPELPSLGHECLVRHLRESSGQTVAKPAEELLLRWPSAGPRPLSPAERLGAQVRRSSRGAAAFFRISRSSRRTLFSRRNRAGSARSSLVWPGVAPWSIRTCSTHRRTATRRSGCAPRSSTRSSTEPVNPWRRDSRIPCPRKWGKTMVSAEAGLPHGTVSATRGRHGSSAEPRGDSLGPQ